MFAIDCHLLQLLKELQKREITSSYECQISEVVHELLLLTCLCASNLVSRSWKLLFHTMTNMNKCYELK